MPRLILHIGTHKTATTSIQQFLRRHDTTLAERGVFYPDYSLVGRGGHYAHLGMVNALMGRHKNYSQKDAEKFFGKVLERSRDFDTTIISAEPFYRHVDNDPGDSPQYKPEEYWPLRNAYIAKMRDLFGEAEVVVVFRRQMDYAQSLYQEHVKVTSYRGTFKEFCKDFWFHFAFADQAEAWNTAFPGLRAMSFDNLLQSGNVVSEFCRLLGLPVEDLDQMPPSNEGMPVDMVVMKRMLHRTPRDREALRQDLETFAASLPEEVQSFFKSRSFFTSAREARTFQKGFTADNERLRPFLMHDLPQDKPVFGIIPKPDRNYGDRIKPPVLDALLRMSLQSLK